MSTTARRIRRAFLRLLRKRTRVAFEDALAQVETHGVDRRCFGWIVSQLVRDGIIAHAGYRRSMNRRHHSGIKRLWKLTRRNLTNG